MLLAIVIFILAGLAEIGGGYMVWLWLREARPLWYGVIGSIVLVFYGIIPTLQSFPSFGRVYAAYGGVFVILAVLPDGAVSSLGAGKQPALERASRSPARPCVRG